MSSFSRFHHTPGGSDSLNSVVGSLVDRLPVAAFPSLGKGRTLFRRYESLGSVWALSCGPEIVFSGLSMCFEESIGG